MRKPLVIYDKSSVSDSPGGPQRPGIQAGTRVPGYQGPRPEYQNRKKRLTMGMDYLCP
jgi:hypothetical protein